MRTIEKAATLPKKFDNDTASGVRCLMSLIGITGYGAKKVSTKINRPQNTKLVTKRPQMSG